MVAVEGDPGNGVLGVAALVNDLDVTTGGRSRVGRYRLAAVELDVLVAHRQGATVGQSLILDPLLVVVGDGLGAALAAADGVGAHDGNSAEDLRARTGDGVADGATVREAR